MPDDTEIIGLEPGSIVVRLNGKPIELLMWHTDGIVECQHRTTSGIWSFAPIIHELPIS